MKKVEAKLISPTDVIELEPFGLTSGMDKERPVMLFREAGGSAVLPVWLSPLDAGIALTQHSAQTSVMSPHDVPLKALSTAGVKLESCYFNEVRGHLQYVKLNFSGSRKLKSLNARADHAISFCLQARTKFYCTRDYLQRCRDVEVELGSVKSSPGDSASKRRHGNILLN